MDLQKSYQRKMTTRYLVVLALACAAASENISPPEHRDIQRNQSTFSSKSSIGRQWIAQLFSEAEQIFDMDKNVSSGCNRDFVRYKMHLQNQTVWAVRMFESSEWPTVGLFAGMVDTLGNYDECLMVSSRELKGQYCRVTAVFNFQDNPTSVYGSSVAYVANEEASVWDTMQMYQKNRIRLYRQRLSWAMCIPSSCSPSELHISLNKILRPLFQRNALNISVAVDPGLCEVEKSSSFSLGFYMVSALFAIILATGITSSIYELLFKCQECKKGTCDADEKKSTLWTLFEDFSLIKGYKKLTDVSSTTELPAGHLMKIVYKIIVIFGHREFQLVQMPMFNTEKAEIVRYPSSIRLTNLPAVDVFFTFSGFLTLYFGLEPTSKLGLIHIARSVTARWLRMVPELCIIQLFFIYVFPHLNDGPVWNQRVQFDVENCKDSIWAHFFCISNLVNAGKQCLIMSWYVTVDMQLTIFGFAIVYVLTKNKKLGIWLAALAFVISSVITFLVTYVERYNGLMLINFNFRRHMWDYPEFTHFYTAFYIRIPPYLVGLLTAYVTKELINRKYRFSNKLSLLLIGIGITMKLLVMVWGSQFYKIQREFSPFENGLYAAIHRWMYISCEAFIGIIGLTSGFGIFDGIMNWKVLIPFGRLSYATFLLNAVIQQFHAASQRTVVESTSFVNEIWWTTADTVYCYSLGLLLHLFIEAPVCSLSKRLVLTLFRTPKSLEKRTTLKTITPKTRGHETMTNENMKYADKNGACQLGNDNGFPFKEESVVSNRD